MVFGYNVFSNYCGLGGEGLPRHKVDELCKKHDEAYGRMIQEDHQNPYFNFNQADADFLRDLYALGKSEGLSESVVRGAAVGFFEAKRILAPKSVDIIKNGGAEGMMVDTSNPGDKFTVIRKVETAKANPEYAKKLRQVEEEIISQNSPKDTSQVPDQNPTPKDQNTGLNTSPIEVTIDGQGNITGRKRPLEPPSIDPLPDSKKKLKPDTTAPAAAMADVEMSGPTDAKQANAANQVTPVSRFKFAYEGIPQQYTTILPYWRNKTGRTLAYAAGSRSWDLYLRMNSIYDIVKDDTVTYSADPTVAADVADAGTKETPFWRDYWSQFWEYWTVVECRYKIDFWIKTDKPDKVVVPVHGYIGLQKPPKFSTGTTDIVYDEYQRWKNVHVGKPMFSQDWGTDLRNFYQDGAHHGTVSGVYHPGDGSHEVAEDELVQTWVKGNSVPKEQNLLWIRLIHGPFSNTADTDITFDYRVKLEYVVQWKDLKAKYQFPMTTTTTDAVSLNETE